MAPAKPTEKDGEQPKPRRRPGRVPVSCAECRRLKLRCDRKVPCETCVKRGCSAICPEGSLTTGKGNRLALADAEELHKKVERLRARSAALEDALRTLQAAVSDEPHPLLLEDSMQITERQNGSSTEGPLLSREEEEVLDAFGTLTLGLRGESRFFGQTARSEYLIHAPTRLLATCTPFPHLSKDLVKEANGELDVPCDHAAVQDEVRACLPTLSQACHLCEIFMEYGQYLWYPIPRKELFDDILGAVYRFVPNSSCDLASTHAIGLLFIVFALATLFDPAVPPHAIEAHEYYLLSRICLRCAPPINDTTLGAVQTMIYMAQYLEMSDCEPAHTGSHKAWLQIGLAVKLGFSIGLHVSSSRWKLDSESGQRRARVFWQLFTYDTWMSFGFGRPPSMSLAFIDCEAATDPEERYTQDGQREWGFHAWMSNYTRLLHTVITAVFGAKTPQYSNVIEYDRKIRDFPIPEHLRSKCGYPGEPEATGALYWQRCLVITAKEATLLSLHRAFFTRALHEQPHDLLRHRYGPSVMAIYRSAWRIIEGAKDCLKRAAPVASRFGYIWSGCLAGGIVMCLLVTRAPTSPLAVSSLQELDVLCELFEQAAGSSQIASGNLDVVRKLRRQGHEVMSKPRIAGGEIVVDQELDRLGGKTHLIASIEDPPISCMRSNALNGRTSGQPSSSTTPSMTTPSMTPQYSAPSPLVSVESIHPTIMQDLRVFEGISTADLAQYNLDMSLSEQVPLYTPAPDIFEELFGPQALAIEPEASGGPPILDSTWQSFVEQLGF